MYRICMIWSISQINYRLFMERPILRAKVLILVLKVKEDCSLLQLWGKPLTRCLDSMVSLSRSIIIFLCLCLEEAQHTLLVPISAPLASVLILTVSIRQLHRNVSVKKGSMYFKGSVPR